MKRQLYVLLADDDKDDRFFFNKILEELEIPTNLITVDDGEKLMTFLTKKTRYFPEVIFLDLNMPRKNGSECLAEIKENKNLKDIPVVIYSTSLHEDVADLLYEKGAHYYIRKTDNIELGKALLHVLTLIIEKKFIRPDRKEFILNMVEA